MIQIRTLTRIEFSNLISILKSNFIKLNFKDLKVYRLHAAREADQVGTQTEAGTLASRQADRGRQQIEDGEHNGGDRRDDHDLLNIRDLAGDDHHRHGDGKAL